MGVRLVNELAEPTAVHWHGVRVPNVMDGAPYLTQPPVAAGGGFDYRFTPPDAGTFWYHAPLAFPEQMSRGLYGPLIVDEATKVMVDRDIAVVLDDWSGAQVTVNGTPAIDVAVKANERIRLRLINAAATRVMPLRIDGHRANVMAIDGQPADPFIANGGNVVLGPGNRIDLFIDATLAPGTTAPLLVFAEGDIALVRIVYDGGAPARPAPLPDAAALPANPLPQRMNFAAAVRRDLAVGGGLADGWMPAQRPPTAPMPLFSVARGRTVMLALVNSTDVARTLHIHGHSFRLLDRLDDGWKPFWLDTVIVPPAQTVRIAFVADNRGTWPIENHALSAGGNPAVLVFDVN